MLHVRIDELRIQLKRPRRTLGKSNVNSEWTGEKCGEKVNAGQRSCVHGNNKKK